MLCLEKTNTRKAQQADLHPQCVYQLSSVGAGVLGGAAGKLLGWAEVISVGHHPQNAV